jgi:hypothetical protein
MFNPDKKASYYDAEAWKLGKGVYFDACRESVRWGRLPGLQCRALAQPCPEDVTADSFEAYASTYVRAPINLWLQMISQAYPTAAYPVRPRHAQRG